MTDRRPIGERAVGMTPERARQLRTEAQARRAAVLQERAAKRERRQARRDAGGHLKATIRRDLLTILEEGPGTETELVARYEGLVRAGASRPAHADSIRKARIALTSEGRIVEADSVTTDAGRTAKLWRLGTPDEPIPQPVDGWIFKTARVAETGQPIYAWRCPYCRGTHWTGQISGQAAADCGRGTARIRVPRKIRDRLEGGTTA